MARAEVRAEIREGRAVRRRAKQGIDAIRSRRGCECPCHGGKQPHPAGEACLCKRIARAGHRA